MIQEMRTTADEFPMLIVVGPIFTHFYSIQKATISAVLREMSEYGPSKEREIKSVHILDFEGTITKVTPKYALIDSSYKGLPVSHFEEWHIWFEDEKGNELAHTYDTLRA